MKVRWPWIIFLGFIVGLLIFGYVTYERTYYAYVGKNKGYSTSHLLRVNLHDHQIVKKDVSKTFDVLKTLVFDSKQDRLFVGGNGLYSYEFTSDVFKENEKFILSGYIMRLKLSPSGKYLYSNTPSPNDEYLSLEIKVSGDTEVRKMKTVIKSYYYFSKDAEYFFAMFPGGESDDGKVSWEADKAKISVDKDTNLWVERGKVNIQNRGGYNPGHPIDWPFMATDPNGNLGIYDRGTAEWEHSISGIQAPHVVAPEQVIPERNEVVLATGCGNKACLKIFNWEKHEVTDQIKVGEGGLTNVTLRRETVSEALMRNYAFWE